jgi:vancomycin resistance protein YoaR
MIPDYKKKLQLMPRLHRLGIYFMIGALIAGGILPALFYGLFTIKYQGMIHPGVVVAGIPLEGLTEADAVGVMTKAVNNYIDAYFPIVLNAEEHQFSLVYDESGIEYDLSKTARAAFEVTRSGDWTSKIKLQWEGLVYTHDLPLTVTIDDQALDSLLASMSAVLAVKPVEPSIELVENSRGDKELLLEAGASGIDVDGETLRQRLLDEIATLLPPTPLVPLHEVGAPATTAMMEAAKTRGMNLIDKELQIRLSQDEVEVATWADVELVELLAFDGGFDEDKLAAHLERLGAKIYREPVDAKFQFDENQHRVKEFTPAVTGQKLQLHESRMAVKAALLRLETGAGTKEAELIVEIIQPDIRLDTVNDLGITELLGTGYSTYKGSIASRVYNVALAAERINGTLIKPGEGFSFNKAIGEISGATGYQKAYIIINGRTELDDGGGVCQVSTTVFRAALDAGLPITERRAHAYRVSYYEQGSKAGLDATIYSPTTDLKFLNDTAHHILIQTVVDSPGRTMAIHFYGTSDGRRAEINNHEVWAITPPPPDVYQDDPSLPAGTIKQVEHKVAGAKAKFDYVVYRGDEIIHEKTFYSAFKPWAAVYLRGTAQ